MINDQGVGRAREFGNDVRRLREEAAMSRQDLAARLGCSLATVRYVEDHGLDPTAARWLQLLAAVDSDLLDGFFLDEDGEPEYAEEEREYPWAVGRP